MPTLDHQAVDDEESACEKKLESDHLKERERHLDAELRIGLLAMVAVLPPMSYDVNKRSQREKADERR
jgi:hypothetical protein